MLPAYTDYIDGGGKADDVDAVMVFKHFVGEDRIAGEVTDGPTGVDFGAGDCDGPADWLTTIRDLEEVTSSTDTSLVSKIMSISARLNVCGSLLQTITSIDSGLRLIDFTSAFSNEVCSPFLPTSDKNFT